MANLDSSAPQQVRAPLLLVTGMSGAGKSTALKALEDSGYEVVDNLPLSLLKRLLQMHDKSPAPGEERPLAVGIDARTRSFDAESVVARIKKMRERGANARVLFIDCAGGELVKRFSETRRRHPLALDRPATDGIAREREILAPLRRWADVVIDTTDFGANDLRRTIREKFSHTRSDDLTLTVMSFGFARGIPRDADMVFDMRFLANPHWQAALRPLTGKHKPVGDYIAADPAFGDAFDRIAGLTLSLLPGYKREGKAYLTIAVGCTGGRHRSVFVAERLAEAIRAAGYTLNIVHRDMSGHSDGAEAGAETAPASEGERLPA